MRHLSDLGFDLDFRRCESLCSSYGYRRRRQSHVDGLGFPKPSEISVRLRRRRHDGIESEDRTILPKFDSCTFATDRRQWTSVVASH
jgi:hypothetical protein